MAPSAEEDIMTQLTDAVLVDRTDGVMTITINRPEVRNAVNGAVSFGVCAAIDELDANKQLRVGILTGAEGNFCSGMDLKAFSQGEVVRVGHRGLMGLVYTPPEKPLIAAIEGYALAGGFEAALACDLIVAASDAQFGLPEAKRGLAALAGGLLRLPRLIPQRIAMELALTGNMASAEMLAGFGLINRIAEPGDALKQAMKLAQEIKLNAPNSVSVSKQIINQQIDWELCEMFTKQAEISGDILSSNDAREGAAAFLEKRAANWSTE
jgi:enoyl-CoA hydratase